MRRLALFFLLSISFEAPAASAQNVEARKNGIITNYVTKGSLEATRNIGCIKIAKAKSDFTPPDLLKGMIACVRRNDYETAGYLYYLARIYAAFDSLRVSDVSARQAGTVLLIQTYEELQEDQKTRLSEMLDKIMGTPELEKRLCGDLQKVGMPTYHPKYMILHGMGAFFGASAEGGLVEDFDGASNWKQLLGSLKDCPG
ncbi:hypothetical protein [Candidatus Phycosocius spiralis]|uniref:Uncharacterized protein n=1 Tax=Candidatus Phycosocius spiralis TaxID=2815099 RepID=A0ABQ4PW32_9PROT|nr:hypothetical protein [Candidatus Phycosocius spiralis]GIU67260.1 hypothetical protein PsB1_1414 [Candidatus Phycosocius spiralis]